MLKIVEIYWIERGNWVVDILKVVKSYAYQFMRQRSLRKQIPSSTIKSFHKKKSSFRVSVRVIAFPVTIHKGLNLLKFVKILFAVKLMKLFHFRHTIIKLPYLNLIPDRYDITLKLLIKHINKPLICFIHM